MFVKISAVIIAFNEAENIRHACESVNFADEILVVDSESTDRTGEIAADCGARVLTKKWQGFSAQKQFAAENARHDWILSLDADERISPELRREILRIKESPVETIADGFRLPRRTFYMNRWIRGGGWYPDWQLRFYNRTRGAWKNLLIHESIEMQSGAKIENLSGDILHYSIPDGAYHHRLIGARYAPLAARKIYERGNRASPFSIATAGFTSFFQPFVLRD